jgi:catalase
LIPEEIVPVKIVGRMVLDRNPDNFFAETEQVAFCPANIVPGVDFSSDPLLQGRLFSYLDTQLKRLGSPNFHQLPINAPKCPFANFQRDGHMQTEVPKGRANYEPNSLQDEGEDGGPRECPASGFTTFPEAVADTKLRVRPETFADHYSQARLFFRSMQPIEQAHIASAFVFELSKVDLEAVRERMISNLRNVDDSLAKRVAAGLAMPLPAASKSAAPVQDLEPSPKLSIVSNMKKTLEGRAVGVLIADGSDESVLDQLKKSVEKAGGIVKVIAPKVGKVKLKDGSEVKADGQLAGTPSVMVDAIALVLSKEGTQMLLKESAAVQFVMDAFGHLKAIGHTAEAQPLLDKAGVEPDAGVVSVQNGFVQAAAQRFFDREPKVRTLA